MHRIPRKLVWLAIVLLGVANLICGWFLRQPALCLAGGAGLAYVAARAVSWRSGARRSRSSADRGMGRRMEGGARRRLVALGQQEAGDETSELVAQLLGQNRYALLLRPEVAVNLSESQAELAREALAEAMGLVPEGEILMGLPTELEEEEEEGDLVEGFPIRVEAFYLDRYPVTNREYAAFVEAGGYQDLSYWEPEILPALMDFVDRSGEPGPRDWVHGHYPEPLAEHPVVGVSWYEAMAYARWVGKRLPTDPEWEKAASWPVQMTASKRQPRRFPWGDVMEAARCNLWLAGHGGTLPVDALPGGAGPGGFHQLSGNVWEWTAGNFGSWSASRRELLLPVAMKSIRGGAFDTYFEQQATCRFQSGEDPLSRRHNIGFRCAVGLHDVAAGSEGYDAAVHDVTAELAEEEMCA